MTDWQIIITGLLCIIALLAVFCAWGVAILLSVHRINRADPVEDAYPRSRYEGMGE